jgi:hypothetical protein
LTGVEELRAGVEVELGVVEIGVDHEEVRGNHGRIS